MASYSPSQPRAAVSINGNVIPGCVESFEVENNNWFAADTYSVTLAANFLSAAYNAKFLCDNIVEVGVLAGFGTGPLTLLVQGYADKFTYKPDTGLITLRGRDRSSDFIDTKTDAKYQNLTASQIATKLAAAHGLTANVTPTSTLSGRYYDIDHARLTNNVTEWTLLNYLAQEEGFDCYVTGTTLNFVPSQQSAQPGFTIQYQQGQGNFTDLTLDRSMTVAKDVVVRVTSWNSKQEKAFTATASRGASVKNATNGSAQVYTYKEPGLTAQQAQEFANARLDEISKHERVVEVSMPGELTLQPRSVVNLTGTGTSFDQTYFIDKITREMSMTGGFHETITMKNHSPESTVGL